MSWFKRFAKQSKVALKKANNIKHFREKFKIRTIGKSENWNRGEILNEFLRTEQLLGKETMQKLKEATVAVFGIGGVGSFTVEALARSGVGKLVLFDGDKVDLTNINRQLIALHNTIGLKKVEVMKSRILDINPNCEVEINECFYSAQNADTFDLASYDYIVDAIDTITSKLILIEKAQAVGVPVISCMGAGNKLDPTRFEVADIYKTSVCPLAKVIRKECRTRDISALKVVYSKEEPLKFEHNTNDELKAGRPVTGSVAFVPSVAGLIMAGEVIKDLLKV